MSFSLTAVATGLILSLGYSGLGLGLVVDSLGVPIPSEVLIPLGTILAEQGRFNLWIIFVLGTAAQVVGGLISYWIGRRGGLPAAEKFGRYVLVSHHDLERTHAVFAKYGRWMTAVGRCLPVIRGLVGYPAGIAEMPVGEFVLWTTFGAAVWTGILMFLGHILSSRLGLIDQIMNKFSLLIIALLIVGIIYHFRHALREQHQRLGAKRKS